MGSIHLILPPLVAWSWVDAGEEAVIGAWIGVGNSAGVTGWRVTGGGMHGISSVLLLRSNCRGDMLGISMFPASYSTLIHQVLRLRVSCQRKYIFRILHSVSQSTIASISLVLCRIRERRSDTRVCVYDHIFDRMVARPSSTASSVTQSTWNGPLYIVSS